MVRSSPCRSTVPLTSASAPITDQLSKLMLSAVTPLLSGVLDVGVARNDAEQARELEIAAEHAGELVAVAGPPLLERRDRHRIALDAGPDDGRAHLRSHRTASATTSTAQAPVLASGTTQRSSSAHHTATRLNNHSQRSHHRPMSGLERHLHGRELLAIFLRHRLERVQPRAPRARTTHRTGDRRSTGSCARCGSRLRASG